MKNIFTKKVFSFTFLILISVFLCLPVIMSTTPVSAQSWVDIGDNPCAQKGNCNPCDLVAVTIRYANGFFFATGAVAMFMFAFGGFVLLTAYGNENRITWGKNVITATLIGMFIVFTAWILTSVFIGAFFGNPTGGDQIKIFGNSWNSCPTTVNTNQNQSAPAGLGEGLLQVPGTVVDRVRDLNQ